MAKFFVPNVFSPDDNGANDFFFPLSGKNIRHVRYFRIFNRWGEQVFENKNFQPNNEQDGWDGRHNGNRAKEDVYVWVMEIELLNGLIEQFKGDVTLLR
ncbi:MAG: T9SS type B sorting domain-containing protein [Saprospiraceae bacterium]|nr:T9SS type B sorting domain-containing protein [Saprospiraceae bacterium]